MIGNHADMQWVHQWAGAGLVNTRVLVFPDELDVPQRQLGILVLPPDPPPIMNARPENYSIDEVPVSTRVAVGGSVRVTIGTIASNRIISGDTFG